MNTCWDNCKKTAVTTGKKLHVSAAVLYVSARNRRCTILYEEGITHCLHSWFTYKTEKQKTSYTKLHGKWIFTPLNYIFFLKCFLSPYWVFTVLFSEEIDVTQEQSRVETRRDEEEAFPREAAGHCSLLPWTEEEYLSPTCHGNTIATLLHSCLDFDHPRPEKSFTKETLDRLN